MIAENPRPSLKKLFGNAPDPSIGNLSQNQVRSLIYANWEDPDSCVVKFNTHLSLNEVNSSIFFRNTRLFLKKLLELQNEITATDRGNLNRAFVAVIFEEMELDDKERLSIKEYNKVINEEDVFPLHIIKIVCELAGLINKRSKRILVARKYKYLLDDENAGELYYRLFEAYFRKFNVGYQDRHPDLFCIQDGFTYSLYRLSKVCNNYQTMDKLFDQIFLPKVKEEIRKTRTIIREIGWLVEVRIIEPLVKFGLLDCMVKKEKLFSRIEKVKKSELFDRFLGWEV